VPRSLLASLASLALLATLAFAACTGETEDTPTPTVTATPEVAATTEATHTPSPARPTATPVLPTSVVGEYAIDGFELPVVSVPFSEYFPSERAPDRIDRVYRDANGEVAVDVLLTADDLGVGTFRLGFESVVADPTGQEIVVAVCERGDCGGFGPPSSDSLTVLHRSTDGGRTWSRYGEIDGGAWLVGWSEGEVIIREPILADDVANAPDRAVRRFPSNTPLRPPREASPLYGSPRVNHATGQPLWFSADGKALLDEAGTPVFKLPLPWDASLFSVMRLTDESIFWSWHNGATAEPTFAAVFDQRDTQLTPTLKVPYGCCQFPLDERRVLVPWVRPLPEWIDAYRDELPVMPRGEPYQRSVPGILDPRTGAIEAITDPFLRAPYRDRDGIRVIAVVPSATTPDTSWREQLEDVPDLIELVDEVLAGPEGVLKEATTVQALCSFHGELFELCADRGLTVTDRFEAVVVTIGLFCEGCEVPPARVETALRGIYERGGVPTEAFWGGSAGTAGATDPGAGVELVGVWTLDDATIAHIAGRWEGDLVATHALEFRSRRPQPGFEVVTGFLLFVDPSQPRPIAILDPTNEAWTSFDAARALGGWHILYEKP